MNYFVTGAEGFIRGFFVQQLVRQQRHIYVLIHESSRERFDALLTQIPSWVSRRIIPIYGNITSPNMGLSANDLGLLKGNVDQFFHFTTVYDIDLDESSQVTRNIIGTTNAIKIAQLIQAQCFHHISPLAGTQLFSETRGKDRVIADYKPDLLQFCTDQESERLVQLYCEIPYQIYRPTAVSGISHGRESGKITGTRYPAKTIH